MEGPVEADPWKDWQGCESTAWACWPPWVTTPPSSHSPIHLRRAHIALLLEEFGEQVCLELLADLAFCAAVEKLQCLQAASRGVGGFERTRGRKALGKALRKARESSRRGGESSVSRRRTSEGTQVLPPTISTPLFSTDLETKSHNLAQERQFEFQCYLLPLPRRSCCESRRWRNRVQLSNSNILFSTNSTKQRHRSKWTKLFSTYNTSLRVTPTTTSSWLSDDVLWWIFLQSLLTKLLMQKTHFFKSGATMGNNSELVKEVEVHMNIFCANE